jgi:hypothetical protein
MLARVLPLDTSFDAFGATYLVPEGWNVPGAPAVADRPSVAPGTGVAVPWGNREQDGIVLEISDADPAGIPNLKPLSSVLSGGAAWATPEHLAVLADLARRNFLPVHVAAGLGLPADVRRRFLKKGPCPLARRPGRAPGAETLAVPQDRDGTLRETARLLEPGAGTWAVLFPDDAMLDDFLRRFPEASAGCTVARGLDTEAVRFKAYVACAAAQKPFLGTRARLTWPLAGYDGLALVEDALAPQLTVLRRPVWCAPVADAWRAQGLALRVVACVPRPETLHRVLAAGGKPEYPA